MTDAWLKLLHVAALSIWSAGLIALPALVRRQLRPEFAADAGIDLRGIVRSCYLTVVSPAAVIAIGSGMALLFVRGAFAGWMVAKLAAVGGMVLVHMHCGRSIRTTGRRAPRLPGVEAVLLMAAATGLVLTVLWLALGKPVLDDALFPDWARQPRPAQR